MKDRQDLIIEKHKEVFETLDLPKYTLRLDKTTTEEIVALNNLDYKIKAVCEKGLGKHFVFIIAHR